MNCWQNHASWSLSKPFPPQQTPAPVESCGRASNGPRSAAMVEMKKTRNFYSAQSITLLPLHQSGMQPLWLMGWWATGKLSNKQYKGYLLKCKKYHGLLQNFEAVVQSKKTLQLDDYRNVSLVRKCRKDIFRHVAADHYSLGKRPRCGPASRIPVCAWLGNLDPSF